MDPEERHSLLQDLHCGRTSRNRDLEGFAEPARRRVLSGYRRVKALVRDLRRPGVDVHARWVENPGHLAVAVEDTRLRYRRVVLLAPWEAEFLETLAEPGATPQIDSPRGA